MKRLLPFALALLFAASAMPALAGDNVNMFASDNQPHAVLRLNGGFKAQRMHQLYLWKINGQRVFKEGEPLIYLKPGTYTLQFRAEGIANRGHVPSANIAAPGTPLWRQTKDTIKLTVVPGKVYFIAAKPHGNGAWTAVVWKQTSQG
ncbi:MAG TPA: hypothetical protein VFK24_00395 [Gammaproteobacteria bacterium]|nr:hypothetical protein [Gammaproteobacteria bacterium]